MLFERLVRVIKINATLIPIRVMIFRVGARGYKSGFEGYTFLRPYRSDSRSSRLFSGKETIGIGQNGLVS